MLDDNWTNSFERIVYLSEPLRVFTVLTLFIVAHTSFHVVLLTQYIFGSPYEIRIDLVLHRTLNFP
jgi:hypothetical protein